MEDFTDGQTKHLITVGRRLAFARNCTVALFLCLAVVAACFAAGDEQQLKNAFVVLIVCGVIFAFAVGLWGATVAFSCRLKLRVCELIAKQTQGSEILSSEGEIALIAAYSGGKMTISKQNSFNELCFDLSALKKNVGLYSNFGVLFSEYLVAFFAKNSGNYKIVTITDTVGKQSEVLTILANGKLVADAKNNYFIKKGIVK